MDAGPLGNVNGVHRLDSEHRFLASRVPACDCKETFALMRGGIRMIQRQQGVPMCLVDPGALTIVKGHAQVGQWRVLICLYADLPSSSLLSASPTTDGVVRPMLRH